MNIVEKQKLFDEYMQKVYEISNIKNPAQQMRAMVDMENYLESIYERGFSAGFEKGVNQSIDNLKN